MTEDTLQFPKDLAPLIGMSSCEITALKNKGCPFLGRKTTFRILRAFVYKTMGAESVLGPCEHLPHLAGSTRDE